jgi:hypothetical protein
MQAADDEPTAPIEPASARPRLDARQPFMLRQDELTAQLIRERNVWDIAQELSARPLGEMAHADGSPRSGFVTAVCAEYVRRGGEHRADNQAVALVVLMILSLSPDELVQLWRLPDNWQPSPGEPHPC